MCIRDRVSTQSTGNFSCTNGDGGEADQSCVPRPGCTDRRMLRCSGGQGLTRSSREGPGHERTTGTLGGTAHLSTCIDGVLSAPTGGAEVVVVARWGPERSETGWPGAGFAAGRSCVTVHRGEPVQ
eukprot:TRINITY_DN10747_c0_g1_i6.p1 TRINITY_DN10747_c0_g1~~TRINITY_DN10747_c0_g1_i6.p1  ORF type:complete len:126 (-),score=0.21 TRINITY_DN10747_c0_g1_i6:178-555(-)